MGRGGQMVRENRMARKQPFPGLQECLNRAKNKITSHHNPCPSYCVIEGSIIVIAYPGESSAGRSASLQIYSRSEIDPETGKGKLSGSAYLKRGKTQKQDDLRITTYKVKFHVQLDFGIPGAFLIRNKHKHKFFLQSATLQSTDNHKIHFECNSWVYPYEKIKTDRIFFSNTSYLPNHTPKALMVLRKDELASLRGNGTGERKEWERIYDYDYYNDLGNPDKGPEFARSPLGGSQNLPYPRRGRTGRPACKKDPLTESQPQTTFLDTYVPPDERLSPKRFSELASHTIRAIAHLLILEATSIFKQDSSSFRSFEEIEGMFSSNRSQKLERLVIEKLKKLVPNKLHKQITHLIKDNTIKFPLPRILAENKWAWKDDEEFARQMLAGINPSRIQCLDIFPPTSKNGTSSIRASHIERNLEGLTLEEAMNEWRLFLLDHHDYLIPFLNKINRNGVCAYASRTLLFLRNDNTLKPIAIELTLPASSSRDELKRVFLPERQGTDAALWQCAKAHVAANDSGYHQLISHWLHTHAVVEPFIIATRRQLSVMHPVHRLLDHHFKDTMHINAIARTILINSGGAFEKTLFTGEVAMELSSAHYKEWRFDEQCLPPDLLKRYMALEDSGNPAGVQLLFQDYPYAADGLDIWIAIETWVREYCSIFYKDDDFVKLDEEIQAWWSEIRNIGHGDKCNETWWYEMKTSSDLIKTLTTLIWIASALHASVNFGQYHYAGYLPNRPTRCRRFIPSEGTIEFARFLIDPDKFYFEMLPGRFEAILGIALIEVLSQHTSSEVYLGQKSSSEWTDDEEIRKKFMEFSENLQEIEKRIKEKNKDPNLKNRRGPAKIPYKLMYPDTSNGGTKWGITGKGIPNSTSI